MSAPHWLSAVVSPAVTDILVPTYDAWQNYAQLHEGHDARQVM